MLVACRPAGVYPRCCALRGSERACNAADALLHCVHARGSQATPHGEKGLLLAGLKGQGVQKAVPRRAAEEDFLGCGTPLPQY